MPADGQAAGSARVLVVDDQPAHLELLRQVLVPAGFAVRVARSGAEALMVAREWAPDLVLLDMHLPDMHGLEVLRRLRESGWGATLPVVAVSALASAEDQALWRQAGCVAVVEKPIDLSTFAATVARWLPGATGAAEPPAERPVADRLGAMLVAHGLITQEQLAAAIAAQSASGRRLGQILVDQGALSEDDLAWALSNQLGYPYIFLTADTIDAEAAHLLPEGFLRERRVLPILRFGQEMTLAMADPTDQRTVDEVVARTGLQVKRALALASNIESMLDRLFARGAGVPRQAPAEVQYLHFHLLQALQQGASEIHFDPGIDGQARVRYRLQGVLTDRPAQPAELHTAILRYLRLLTGLDDRPAGRGTGVLTVGEVEVLLVAAFVPTAGGPAAAVAVYPRRSDPPDAESLGLREELLQPLRRALQSRRGVVLLGCADPWLRSTLLHLLLPVAQGSKVWALETLPVYHRPTVQQTSLASPGEVARYLRLGLTAGVDVLLADDLSRPQAVRAALEAGRMRLLLGGHPQDSAVGVLAQALHDGGTALAGSVLGGVLAARAVRVLCPECKRPGPRPPGLGTPAFTVHGCEACGFTGFRGQRLLAECWTPDETARTLLYVGRAAALLQRVARLTEAQMSEQGRALVEAGLTSPEELVRVLERDPWTSPTSSS